MLRFNDGPSSDLDMPTNSFKAQVMKSALVVVAVMCAILFALGAAVSVIGGHGILGLVFVCLALGTSTIAVTVGRLRHD
jgi:hypothetical protein